MYATLRLEIGGAERDRTVDLLNAIQALSQLSYGPTLRVLHLPKSEEGTENFERVRYHSIQLSLKVTTGHAAERAIPMARQLPCLREESLLISGLNLVPLTSSPKRLIRETLKPALLSLTIPRDG